MSERHKHILERANAASRAGDVEGFLQNCTEDTVWTFVGEQTLVGKGAVRAWLNDAYKTPPEFEVYRMVAEGDFLTAIGEIVLVDENGKGARHAYCDVWSFRDGLLDTLHAFVVKGSIQRGAFA